MQKVLVLGATSAIAQATAARFAANGAHLVLVGRNAERLDEVAKDLRVRGAKDAVAIVADLCEVAGHPALIERAAAALGGLDVALLAYGTLGDQKASERDFAVAQRELQTNFVSAVSLLTELANRMEAARAGTLVVLSSVAGDRGRQSNYVYGACKAGLTAFTSGLRNRLQRSGVRVVTVKPGFVDTPMTASVPKNALFASPEQVAVGIERAVKKGKGVVYLPGFWRTIMWLVRSVPEPIFQRLRL